MTYDIRSNGTPALLVFAQMRTNQDSEKAQQLHRYLLNLVIGQKLSELGFVMGLEFLNGLATQLLGCFHADQFTAALINRKRPKLAANGKSCIL